MEVILAGQVVINSQLRSAEVGAVAALSCCTYSDRVRLPMIISGGDLEELTT